MKTSLCRITLLGGIRQIGCSGILLECGVDALLVDFGRSVDDRVADLEPVLEAHQTLRAVLLTHAHEDHVGGLSTLSKLLPGLALWGTRPTIALTAERHPGLASLFAGELIPGESLRFGIFQVDCFSVPHSIPGACAFLIASPAGSVLISGDFSLDGMPEGSSPFPAGADLAFIDCTGAVQPRRMVGEAGVRRSLAEIFHREKNDIYATCFSSNVVRLEALLAAAAQSGRGVCVDGPALRTVFAAAAKLGIPGFSGPFPVPAERQGRAPALILVSGSQGEPGSAADLLSRDPAAIGPEAAVIVSASPVPGNESSWRALLNRFAQRTNRIYLSPAFAVHASGHASREELAVVFRRLDCRCLVPVHADPWLRSLSLAVAEENGIPGDRVIFPVEGDRLVLQDKRVRLPIRKAPVFEPAGDGSRQERKRLAEEGVAFLCVSRKSDRIGSISITVRGFFRAEEHAGLLNDISDRLSGVLEDRIRSGPAPNRELRQVLQQEGQRLFRERCGRHPWVLAQIIDSADLT